MTSKEYRRMLKHRLSKRKNREFLKWAAERKKQGGDLHHIIGKRNDYLVAEIPHEKHIQHSEEIDTFEAVIDALERLFDYIEELEK